jgi:hypothetical protein
MSLARAYRDYRATFRPIAAPPPYFLDNLDTIAKEKLFGLFLTIEGAAPPFEFLLAREYRDYRENKAEPSRPGLSP